MRMMRTTTTTKATLTASNSDRHPNPTRTPTLTATPTPTPNLPLTRRPRRVLRRGHGGRGAARVDRVGPLLLGVGVTTG